MSKGLFIFGSPRQRSFHHPFAAPGEKALAGKAEVSYLDYKDGPFFNQKLALIKLSQPTEPLIHL